MTGQQHGLVGQMLRLFESQPFCLHCDNALCEQKAGWHCVWCGLGGPYTQLQHRDRKIRVRVVEHSQVPDGP